MVDILEYAHKFVPEASDGEPIPTFFEGDYLTFERSKVAQSSKQNGLSSKQRLDGFIIKDAEFHNQAELMKVPYYYKIIIIIKCI